MTPQPPIPQFGIGETQGVPEYISGAVIRLCEKLKVPADKTEDVRRLGLETCIACAEVMQDVLTRGAVEPIPAARTFWNTMGELFVQRESKLFGASNLQTAMSHLHNGGNVLAVQNHRSGADTMVWETLVNRHYGSDVAADWAYMSGHAVNLYLIPFIFTAAMRRFQIFSRKYQSSGLPGIANDTDMRAQNLRALRALAKYTQTGGKLIGLYPEGGRGDHAMKRGEARTMCVAMMMAKSRRNLMILPTYVDGSTNVLPVVRGGNEYNEVFIHAQQGTASVSVGRPVMWDELTTHPSVTSVQSEDGQMQAVCDLVLSLIAALAPDDQRGCYRDPQFQSQVAGWV